VDRLDLELYAERLARHAERAADDLADARLRLAWCEVDAAARTELADDEIGRLRACGALAVEGAARAAEDAVRERLLDLHALRRLQTLVERLRREAVQLETGATATSRPPSSS
jgi:hypothetical protein